MEIYKYKKIFVNNIYCDSILNCHGSRMREDNRYCRDEVMEGKEYQEKKALTILFILMNHLSVYVPKDIKR